MGFPGGAVIKNLPANVRDTGECGFDPWVGKIPGAPGGSDGKESACSTGDLDLIPGLGRSPGEGNGNPL